MKVREAMEIAKEWVELHGSKLPGFCGAYFGGSINYLPRDESFADYRDVDVFIVVEDVRKIGQRNPKVIYKGLLLDTPLLRFDRYRSAEDMLARSGSHNLAIPSIISDPTGRLTEFQQAIAQGYAQRRWVQKRCEDAKQSMRNFLDRWSKANTAAEMREHCSWFVLWIANLIATAHLRPLTIRRYLEQTRELLQHQDRLDLHESILQIIGSAHMSREQVETALQRCLKAFDRAVEVAIPIPGSYQLNAHRGRYIAEGSQVMIDGGHHREVMGWISFHHNRSNDTIQEYAPEDEKAGFQAEFDQHLSELGILTVSDCQRRLELARSVADEVILFSDEVVRNHPDIKEDNGL